MRATLSSKGQITLPKKFRDSLGLVAGSQLEFELLPDESMTVRRVVADARRLRGILKSPLIRPLSVDEKNAAIAEHVQKFVIDGPVKRPRKAPSR